MKVQKKIGMMMELIKIFTTFGKRRTDMTFQEFKNLLASKTVGRVDIPDNGVLVHRLQTALDHVATEAYPKKLESDVEIADPFRVLYNHISGDYSFIRRPVASITADIDIDDGLLGAVALYIMAGLERPNAGTHMALYNKELALFSARQIEQDIGLSSEDVDTFGFNESETRYGF